jgi:hypothetical protein
MPSDRFPGEMRRLLGSPTRGQFDWRNLREPKRKWVCLRHLITRLADVVRANMLEGDRVLAER